MTSPSPSNTYDVRVALVTGAGSGIGRATACALLHAGWHVVLAGRRADALQAVIDAEVAADPAGNVAERLLGVATDVTDRGLSRCALQDRGRPLRPGSICCSTTPACRSPARRWKSCRWPTGSARSMST